MFRQSSNWNGSGSNSANFQITDLVRGGRHCTRVIPSLPDQPKSSRGGSVPGQFSQHLRQSHFGVSSLEATPHRGLQLVLNQLPANPLTNVDRPLTPEIKIHF